MGLKRKTHLLEAVNTADGVVFVISSVQHDGLRPGDVKSEENADDLQPLRSSVDEIPVEDVLVVPGRQLRLFKDVQEVRQLMFLLVDCIINLDLPGRADLPPPSAGRSRSALFTRSQLRKSLPLSSAPCSPAA